MVLEERQFATVAVQSDVDGAALDAYPYLKPSAVGDEAAKDADRYLINVAPALRPYVREPVPRATGTVELGAEEAKGA